MFPIIQVCAIATHYLEKKKREKTREREPLNFFPVLSFSQEGDVEQRACLLAWKIQSLKTRSDRIAFFSSLPLIRSIATAPTADKSVPRAELIMSCWSASQSTRQAGRSWGGSDQSTRFIIFFTLFNHPSFSGREEKKKLDLLHPVIISNANANTIQDEVKTSSIFQ